MMHPVLYDAVARAVSAAYLPPRTFINVLAGPGATEPIEFIQYRTEYSEVGAGELVAHVRGEATDISDAIWRLLAPAVRNLSTLTLATNAAILVPHLQVAYEPRPGGRFRAIRTLGADPPGALRAIDVLRTGWLIEAIDRHPKEARLVRAVENYAEALRRIQPLTSIPALMHLWIAVENVTRVVTARLEREHGVARTSDLGEVLGVLPRPKKDFIDVRDVTGEVRRRYVFEGDEEAHTSLRRASDGVEHGFSSFGKARELASGIFDRAAQHVRRSILRESGLSDENVETLATGIYAAPLPLWRSQVITEGILSSDTDFDFDRRPMHIRPEARLRVESIASDDHATSVAVDVEMTAPGCPEIQVERSGLDAPGGFHLGRDTTA
jgi:uncharacterized protein YbaR (Trm112 family)